MEREQILCRLRERIVAFAASHIGRDAAEDVAQEVMLLLEEKYAAVRALEELVPLSLKIARFKLWGVRRKAVRRGEYVQVALDDLPLADPGPGPLAEFERREMVERLEAALARLGERCKELFRLKLAGKSFEEIRAAMKAKSLNTVYTWDFRCRQQLLERLGGSYEPRRR